MAKLRNYIKNPPVDKFELAVNWSPAFEQNILSGFKTEQLRKDRNAHIHIEAEIYPIFKHDADCCAFVDNVDLDLMHYLTFELSKLRMPCAMLLKGFTLAISHCRLL